MKVGFIGLGKLGLPVSCAMVQKGHEVFGYDVDPVKAASYRSGTANLYEPDIDNILSGALSSGLHICSTVKEAVEPAEIVFIAVPTPSRDDDAFDTAYVKDAIRDVADVMQNCMDYKVISVISTVLPGTTRNEFLPVLVDMLGEPGPQTYGVAYNAQFIAMGTTVDDMLNPEFVLIGELDQQSGDVMGSFYSQLVTAPLLRMSMESAEMVKMSYNTMIGFKIVFANTIMELCDKIPHADCDVVSGALCKANKRLLSPRYMRGGMGDGGGCHPRDNRALSWLADFHNLSADPFDFVMRARGYQSEYLASVVTYYSLLKKLPVVILGRTFKPETNLTLDSPAFLLGDQLVDRGIIPQWHDPITGPKMPPQHRVGNTDGPFVYFVATRHADYTDFPYVPGSVIIDPWRHIPDQKGCEMVRIGGAHR